MCVRESVCVFIRALHFVFALCTNFEKCLKMDILIDADLFINLLSFECMLVECNYRRDDEKSVP